MGCMEESRGVIESCTILTTAPNALIADMHDRMPVIVPADKYEIWLDPDVNDFEPIRDILKPYEADQMRRYPVSTTLNNSKNEGADAAAPVKLDALLKSVISEPTGPFQP